MNKGFELLVPASRDKELQILAFEKRCGFKLPDLYRDFLKRFDLGEPNLLRAKRPAISSHKLYYYKITRIESVINNHIILEYFDTFFDMDNLNRFWGNLGVEDRYKNNELLVIGYYADIATGFICVGYGEENKDKIYGIMDEGYEDDPTFPFIIGKYADNIFDFVESLSEVRKEDLSPEIAPVYCCFWEPGMKKPLL